MLVGDREVVPGRRVGGIDIHRLLPAVEGFVPQPVLRDLDAELDLLSWLVASVGVRDARSGDKPRETTPRRMQSADMNVRAA